MIVQVILCEYLKRFGILADMVAVAKVDGRHAGNARFHRSRGAAGRGDHRLACDHRRGSESRRPGAGSRGGGRCRVVCRPVCQGKGATVYGTASAVNLDFIRSLGVDEAIDYAARDFTRIVREADFVLDTVGGKTLDRSLDVVKRGGILLSIVDDVPQQAAEARGIRVKTVSPAGREDLADIARFVDAGKAKPVIRKVFPLEEAREAHALSETGHGRGRIVLQLAGR